MAQPTTAQEIYDTIQKMQPDDALTLADAVLGMLRAQQMIAKAVLEIGDHAESALTLGLRDEMQRFLRESR